MSQQEFAAAHYAPRAADYVTSIVHASGPDLDQIADFMAGQTEAVVLDLGCGGGHVSFAAAPHVGKMVAVDVTPEMLAQVAREAAARGLHNIETCHAAAENLPFAAASFDAVLCRFSAHHWQDLAAGLREARRVLKPGGMALIIDTVAPDQAVWDTHLQALELLRDASHVRNYTVSQWVAALAQAGFSLRGFTLRTLRMVFCTWVARTQTPPPMQAAIRQLQQGAPPAVQTYFALGEDGSFDLKAAAFELVAA